MKNEKQAIEIFKLVNSNVDTNLGQICIKGKYADETRNISVSGLIQFFDRDIFLAQKDEALLKTRFNFKVTSGISCPAIEITLDNEMSENDFKIVQLYLVQILWAYNYYFYDAVENRQERRFSYAFTFRPASYSAKAA